MPTIRPNAGPFRGLVPYGEEDARLLFGRDEERAALLALCEDPQVPLILLTGEVASGKTSLLRAGLVPALRAQGQLPLYLECGPGWDYQLRAAVGAIIGRPPAPGERPDRALSQHLAGQGQQCFLILDQLEQVLWMEERQAAQLAAEVVIYAGLAGVRLVVSAGRGNLHALARAGLAQGTIPPEHTVTLGRWDKDRAGQVMEQMVLGGGGYMEAGLPQAIADDLCASGPVLPAALQVAGHATVLNKIARVRDYVGSGGATALSAFYVEQLAGQAGGWRARRLLAVLSEQPSPFPLLTAQQIALRAGLAPESAESLLAQLEQQGLVRRYTAPAAAPPAGDPAAPPADIPATGGYAILHHHLRQPIRDFVAPVNRGRAKAKQALRRRYSGRGLLWPHEVAQVLLYMGQSLDAQEQAIFLRSARAWLAVAGGLVLLPVVLILSFFIVLSGSSYLDLARTAPGPQRVVLRSGSPGLQGVSPLFPGRFDQLELDTGLTVNALPPALVERIRQKEISGDLYEADADGPLWLKQLLGELPPLRRAALLMLAGAREAGGKLLRDSAGKSEDRSRLIELAALLFGDSKPARELLRQSLDDSNPAIRLLVVEKVRQLEVNENLPLLRAALADEDAQVRLAAIQTLRQAEPLRALPLWGAGLLDVDPRVQQEAFSQLEQAAQTHPGPMVELALETEARAGAEQSERVGQQLQQLIQKLLAADPERMARHLTKRLESATEAKQRVTLLRWMAAVAGRVKGEAIGPILSRLAQDQDLRVQTAALSLLARYQPYDEAMAKMTELARTSQPRQEAAVMRRAAALGLGMIPGPLDKKRWNLLKALVRDRSRSVRRAAIWSLLRVGPVGLMELSRSMKTAPPDVAQVALREVCGDPEIGSRAATAILGVAWRMKRQDLRQEALACAASLASASPRLNLWLADQASVDKDHQVRRAGAEAAARALQEGGPRYLRLARLYLGDRDPDIRAAFLEALTRRVPEKPQFLYGTIERATRDSSAEVRAQSAQPLVLAAPEAQVAVKALQKLLQDPEEQVRLAAVAAAAQLEPGPAVAALDAPIAALVIQAPREDALSAVRVAGKLKLVQVLKRATQHSEAVVRAAAVEALAPHAPVADALPVLEATLREKDPDLRRVALETIARLSARLGQPAVALLGRGTEASDPSERWASFKALGQVRGKGTAAALQLLQQAAAAPSEERRRLAMVALSELVECEAAAAEALVGGILDPARDVRAAAISGLSRFLGRRSSLDALWSLLLQSERSDLLRRVAIGGLAWHGRLQGTAGLQAKLQSLPGEAAAVTRIAANLSLALSRSAPSPQPLINWLFGW